MNGPPRISAVVSLLLVSSAMAPLLFGQAPQESPQAHANAQTKGPTIIAHRGDSAARPENTIAAIRSAVAVKAEWIEFDVRSIRDGSLYLFHDADLKRFKKGKRKVATLTTNEVAELDVGTWFDPTYADQRAPTLRAAIQACLDGKTLPLIERKTGTPEAYLKVIRELEAESDVVLQSFDWAFLVKVREQAPTLRIGALHGKEMDETHWQRLAKLKPEWVGWNHEQLSKDLIARFHKEGFKVAVWTVNDEAAMRKFAGWQVDAIITDRPAAARKAVTTSIPDAKR